MHILNACPFNYSAVARSGKAGSVKRLTTPFGWLYVFPTDRPK